jgi:23S rRNA (cytosine1962-C5)-methyltransferase
MNNLILIKKDRFQRILENKHPWIFSGAIAKVPAEAIPGDIVNVCDLNSKPAAQAVYNPNSDIALRVISWNPDEVIDDKWFSDRIKNLYTLKEQLLDISKQPEENKNYRLVFSDADSVPGLIIDRYGLVFVIQLHTLFADKNRDLWVSIIKSLWQPVAIYERSDVDVRKKEGLSDFPSQLIYGKLPSPQIIEEDGFKIPLDIENGQKTGFFLDLRQARKVIEKYCGIFKINNIQNYFGYTGVFNLYAAKAGVNSIEHIDSSEKANAIAKETASINKLNSKLQIITEDCFKYLESTKPECMDAIILDPPSFVKSKVKIGNAAQAYERLNELAMKKLKKGGILFTFCCSSYISEELFQKILFKASTGAMCNIKVLEKIGHDYDHAWPLTFPEGRYFQGLVLYKE